MVRLSPIALAGALLATTVSVLAAAPSQATTRHVRLSDVDLASPNGRAIAEKRLSHAVNSVCMAERTSLSIVAKCREETMAQARTDLDRVVRRAVVQMAAR